MEKRWIILLFCFVAGNLAAQKSLIAKRAEKIYTHANLNTEQKDNRLKRWNKLLPKHATVCYFLSFNELDASIESSKTKEQLRHYNKALTWAKRSIKNSEMKDTFENGKLFDQFEIGLSKFIENQVPIIEFDDLFLKTVEIFNTVSALNPYVLAAQLKGEVYNDSTSGLPNQDFFLPVFSENEEREFLIILNKARIEKGMNVLELDESLSKACRYHAQDMAKEDYFSHQSNDRIVDELHYVASTFDRIQIFAPFCLSCSENIAAGNGTAVQTYQQWYNSPGHYKNMFNPKAKKIGIGSFYFKDSSYGYYWVMNTSGDF
ncbi:MAG: CAP domain-containing protein [Bacteroidetes bacterium]|nr:CAP domain-containing protein [Bacteroidota bacterium]